MSRGFPSAPPLTPTTPLAAILDSSSLHSSATPPFAAAPDGTATDSAHPPSSAPLPATLVGPSAPLPAPPFLPDSGAAGPPILHCLLPSSTPLDLAQYSRGPTRHGPSASRLCSHHLLPHGRRGTLGARRTSTRGLPLHCRPDRWPLPFPHPAHPFLCPLPATTRGHRAPRTRRLDHSRQLFAPCDRRSQFRLSGGVPRPSLVLGHAAPPSATNGPDAHAAVALGHVVGTAPVPARGGLFSTTTD